MGMERRTNGMEVKSKVETQQKGFVDCCLITLIVAISLCGE